MSNWQVCPTPSLAHLRFCYPELGQICQSQPQPLPPPATRPGAPPPPPAGSR